MADHNDIVARLRYLAETYSPLIMDSEWNEAADEIERLRKERDEARQEVCEWVSLHTRPNEKSPRLIAIQRGWNCFSDSNDECQREAL